MTLKDILEKCGRLSVYKNRCITDDYCELVFFSKDIDQWDRALSSILGSPRKSAGVKPVEEDLNLTKDSGGIRVEQTLFEKTFDDATVIAKFWPWNDKVYTTLKMALLKKMKKDEKMKFSTKGDKGETSLLGGQRVPKYDLRPDTYGTLDEASSALGVARAGTGAQKIKEIILSVQKDLLIVGTELSTLTEDYGKLSRTINESDVKRIEKIIDELQQAFEMKREFIFPGESVVSAQIDVGRTIIRRAERKAARMKNEGLITNEKVNQYLNRLADMLFTLARYEEAISKKG
ncbi:MAG TPA: cob(I)yrinic acid a,c-diamide adenosyltransferase [Desulfobacterales bacterium]|nr:cob(I)yrinic acid a,c-diamide adenosyltransferase [Desulfobacterales bacterium]